MTSVLDGEDENYFLMSETVTNFNNYFNITKLTVVGIPGTNATVKTYSDFI